MKIKLSFKAVALSAALAVAAVAPIAIAQVSADTGAHQGHGWGGRGDWGKGAFFFGGLDLTDAQKTQLQQIRESHRQAMQSLQDEMRTKRQEIWQLNQAATFDESAAAAKLADIAPVEAKVMGEQFRMRQEMLNVLTPDQRTKLDQRKAEWKQKAETFKANGGRHGRGSAQPDQ